MESWHTLQRNSKGKKRHEVIVSLIPYVQNVTSGVSFHGNFISIVRAEGVCNEWEEETEWSSIGIRLCVQCACEQETRQGLQGGLVGFPLPSRGTGLSKIFQLLFLEVLEGFPPKISFSSKPFSPIFLLYIRDSSQAYEIQQQTSSALTLIRTTEVTNFLP